MKFEQYSGQCSWWHSRGSKGWMVRLVGEYSTCWLIPSTISICYTWWLHPQAIYMCYPYSWIINISKTWAIHMWASEGRCHKSLPTFSRNWARKSATTLDTDPRSVISSISMKFGRNYHKHQLPEWADVYMNYATLKRLCEESTTTANLQGNTHTSHSHQQAIHKSHDTNMTCCNS